MKRLIAIFSLVGLLHACTSPNNQSFKAVSDPAGCPEPAASLPEETLLLKTQKRTYIFARFDYTPQEIVRDANTVKFLAREYDFVFCRRDRTWTVQPGTLKNQPLPSFEAENLANPHYQSSNIQGKTYRYRVLLEPNPFPNWQVEPTKVIFELITPDGKQARHTLYTLNDLQQAAQKRGWSAIGIGLGVPRITASLTQGDRLWWTVAFEQGEGNGGIATIVSYDPKAEQVTLIQPPEIWWQQILTLAITGDPAKPTFWMGTKLSAEGSGSIPSMGLVAYTPKSQNLNSGALTSYTVHNSPLVGAIPTQLKQEGDTLWVGTRNGACQLQWQAPDNPQSWNCWRFAAVAQLPPAGVPLYSALANQKPALTLSPTTEGKTIEVLWWMWTNPQVEEGRYEVRNTKGFTITSNQGAVREDAQAFVPAGQPRVNWLGSEWHWHGSRFVRGLDHHVEGDALGGGSSGIAFDTRSAANGGRINWNAIRGDFDLLKLSAKSTSVKYYSGWVEDTAINPYPSVLPSERPDRPQPNPLEARANQLPSP